MNNYTPLKRAVIKEEYVAITGDTTEAIILNQLIYWSERIKDFDKFILEEAQRKLQAPNSSSNEEDTQELLHGWIYKKASELKDEIMSTDSEVTINRKVNSLVSKGLVDRRRNPKLRYDRTYQYRVNFHNLIVALAEKGYTLEGYRVDLNMYIKPLELHNLQNEDCKLQNEDSKNQNEDLKNQNEDLKNQNEDLKNQIEALKNQIDGTIPEITTDTTTNITIENTNREIQPTPPLSKPIQDILDIFKSNVSEISYRTWIEPTIGKAYVENDEIVIPCPNPFTADILEKKYIPLMLPNISFKGYKIIEIGA